VVRRRLVPRQWVRGFRRPELAIAWDLGQQLASGHIEVTIEGLSLESLVGANMHLIELFDDGGHWSSDRAINIRAYGDDCPDEWGDLKLKVWDNPASLVEEARFYDFPWDAGAHVWAIDWDQDSATMSCRSCCAAASAVSGIDT
jgi:hypothetical protein